jgi:plastocyanin
MARLFILAAAVLCATTAQAADIRMRFRTAGDQPIQDVVVTVNAPGAAAPKVAGPYRIVQENIAFAPRVLIVPVGAEVEFPNRDKVRHHVYSFSPAKRFQLKLYGREERRSVSFPVAGVVALGCNIHDRMAAFVKVVDTPYAAKSGPDGEAILKDVPAGPVVVKVWHPDLRAQGNETARNLTLGAGGLSQTLVLDLREARR